MIKSPFELPGYNAALEFQRFQRSMSFLPVDETVEGFELRPITLRTYSILRIINSPFIDPFRTPTPDDIAKFLWLLNPNYDPKDSKGRSKLLKQCRRLIPNAPITTGPKWFQKIYNWKVSKTLLAQAKVVYGIRKFMEESMADRPDFPSAETPEYYSDETYGVAVVAQQFGWEEEFILNLPLKRFFQYINWIREGKYLECGQTPLLSNPSDKIIDEYLGGINGN